MNWKYKVTYWSIRPGAFCIQDYILYIYKLMLIYTFHYNKQCTYLDIYTKIITYTYIDINQSLKDRYEYIYNAYHCDIGRFVNAFKIVGFISLNRFAYLTFSYLFIY